jgi:hypothetical protein
VDRRGKWMWCGHGICLLLFVVTAPFGPIGLLVGAVGTAIGFERLLSTWGSVHRLLSVVFLVFVSSCALALFMPIWGHSGFRHGDGKVAITHHDHYLWQADHVH